VTSFELIEGECYTYKFDNNYQFGPLSLFRGCVFVGETSYLVFQSVDDDEVVFINPARLRSIRPDTW